MPIIKSAIKKLRKDIKRYKVNRFQKSLLSEFIKKAKKTKTAQAIRNAVSAIDKAAKAHLIHKNKAARLKSRLSRLVAVKQVKKTVASAKKPSAIAKRKKKTKE